MSNIIVLNQDTASVQYLSKVDKRLAKVIQRVGEIKYSPYTNGYSFLVHEIIEQMLSIKAGAKIYGRLEDMCNSCISPETIMALSDSQLKATGTSNAKVMYIRNLTEAISSSTLVLNELENLSDNEIVKKLTMIKGIGNWTAKMYLIFVLDRQDVLPFEDGAFIQSYRWMYKTDKIKPIDVNQKCKKWKPYSSIAARYLYQALDMQLTKEEFCLYK